MWAELSVYPGLGKLLQTSLALGVVTFGLALTRAGLHHHLTPATDHRVHCRHEVLSCHQPEVLAYTDSGGGWESGGRLVVAGWKAE